MALGERRVMDAPPGTAPAVEARRPVPWVSWGIIIACALVFIAETMGFLPRMTRSTLQAGALYGPAIVEGQWWRILGHVFEHGGVIHLGLNMSVVWTLGMVLERAIGSGRFAVVSLVSAFGSAALSLVFAFDIPMVGASGMILGYAGAILPIATKQGRQQILIWLVQIAAITFIPGLHVSWQGHLGGFLFGLPCGFLLRNGARRFWPAAPFLITAAAVAAWYAATVGARYSGG